MPASITNSQYLSCLLKLGRVLHRDFALQIKIAPPVSPSTSGARITVTPVKHAEFLAFPETYFPDEWREELYSSTDKVAQLWVGFYHMIEERLEERIFGGRYASSQSLYDKVHALYTDYMHGQPVSIFLSDFYVADEFGCVTAPGNTLAEALDHIRQIANEEGQKLFDAHRLEISSTPQPSQLIEVVDNAGNATRVWEPCIGVYRIESTTTSTTTPVDNSVREELMRYLHDISISRTGAGFDSRTPHALKDCYVWDISVSDLISYITSLPTEKQSSNPDVTPTAVIERYRDLAACAWYASWRRTAVLLPVLGNVPEHLTLRFLHDYAGPDIATCVAATGSCASSQRGITHISYSAFAQTKPADEDCVSLAISSTALRDVGRLSLDDNVVRPPLMTDSGSLVVTSGQSGMRTTVAYSSSLVKTGRLDNNGKIG